jgi:hypothetical protein
MKDVFGWVIGILFFLWLLNWLGTLLSKYEARKTNGTGAK